LNSVLSTTPVPNLAALIFAPVATCASVINSVGMELFVLLNIPIKIFVRASLDNEPLSQVTLTVVSVEKDDDEIVP
jgi:hypothetical protein